MALRLAAGSYSSFSSFGSGAKPHATHGQREGMLLQEEHRSRRAAPSYVSLRSPLQEAFGSKSRSAYGWPWAARHPA
jgi:hypothetical protein